MEQGVEICRNAASGGISRRAAMDSGRAFLLAIGILLAPWQKGVGDELRFATAAQWRQWELPLGAVELTRAGSIRPVAVRRNNNAALDAVAFGGGISRVGSNALEAPGVLDGDEDTGWGPDLDEKAEDWFVEVDLGRVVSAHRVHLIFSAHGPPFEIFDLLLSTGEQFRDETRTQIEGTLAYRIKERFTEDRRRITYELNPDAPFPVHFVRVEVLKAASEARLVEIEVEAFGDNLVQGAIERGGSVDIVVGVDTKNPDIPNLTNALQLMDGRISTVWSNIRATRADTDVIAQITMDLGAVYWVDQVRMITFSRQYRGFWFNFYEVLTSDGARAPDGSLRWTKHFSGWGGQLNRIQGLADHRFTSLPVRFVRIRWKTWDAQLRRRVRQRGCAWLRSFWYYLRASGFWPRRAGSGRSALAHFGFAGTEEYQCLALGRSGPGGYAAGATQPLGQYARRRGDIPRSRGQGNHAAKVGAAHPLFSRAY